VSAGAAGNGSRSDDLREVIGRAAQNERRNMNVQGYGEIVSFDPATQTAKVKLMRQATANGAAVDQPELLDVPVLMPRSDPFCVTFPVQPGNKCVVRFDDKDNKNYLKTGQPSQSKTDRNNSLSDATAELTGYPAPAAIADYHTGQAYFGRLNGQDGYSVTVDGDLVTETTQGRRTLITKDDESEVQGNYSVQIEGTHNVTSTGKYSAHGRGGLELMGKSGEDLLQILDELLDALTREIDVRGHASVNIPIFTTLYARLKALR